MDKKSVKAFNILNHILFPQQVITIGKHVKGYHYIIANLVSVFLYWTAINCDYIFFLVIIVSGFGFAFSTNVLIMII